MMLIFCEDLILHLEDELGRKIGGNLWFYKVKVLITSWKIDGIQKKLFHCRIIDATEILGVLNN